MAMGEAARGSHHTFDMPAPRLRLGLGMPPFMSELTES